MTTRTSRSSATPALRRALPRLLALAAIAVLAAGGVAWAAKSFRPASRAIVVNASIAGVRLYQADAKAKARWPFAKCTKIQAKSYKCTWQGGIRNGSAEFNTVHGKVYNVMISAGYNAGVVAKSGPLAKLTTSKGIGLGSTSDQVIAAHPGGQVEETPSEVIGYNLRKGKITTHVVFAGDRVASITISDTDN